ncbi:hypothetical protein HYH03_008716 [Edaphochlamys debaryana]|uniref:Glutathione S-transferase n=1 Tax=Edaphochlamys debaryana TaxID=47281 RepID=A0A835XZC7_9CHLO|nr:hypothetical protein HYH03_008716 [Edaphochlamys debaryana]|eukprot:KAG2493053.1 hypothetical protein HYH03_008716 [Edaphochlamys debaryana]
MSSFLSKLMGSNSGKGSTAAAPAPTKSKVLNFADTAPSWDELEEMVRAQHAALGVDFWADVNDGPTHAAALRRTFGSTEPIRVKLYRDHAAWCPYCHKVWLQLEEKRIPYVIEKINMRCYGDKPPAFLAKVPSGLLPVLELDGRVVTESTVIMALLEASFPDHKPLMPPQGTPQRARADSLMRLERRLFSDWLNWLCQSWGHDRAKAQFDATMDAVAEALEADGGPYFLGPELSLVDCTFAPMLERINASLAYYKGAYIRGRGRWPAVERWFDAMESRPTYMGTRSDFYTHAHDLPPQLGGCAMTAEGEPVAAALDGTDGVHWRLPLEPLTATSFPEPYSRGDDPPRDRLAAAAKLVRNREAVVKFALRGPGQAGPRPVSAPLCDPTAVPALEHTAACDAALRHLAHALLVGVEAKQVSPQAMQASPSAPLAGAPIVSALEYMRDRVCVPRDLSYPAARQFRAHANWVLDNLQAA